jgi:hypothetical protein
VEIARKTEEQKSPGIRLNIQWSRIARRIFANGTNNFPSRVSTIINELFDKSLRLEKSVRVTGRKTRDAPISAGFSVLL